MKKISVLLSFLIVISCLNPEPSNKIPDEFDYGSVKNGAYKNAFFDMIIPINNDWNVQSQEKFDQFAEIGTEVLFEDNEKIKEDLKSSKITTANLLAVFKYTDKQVLDYNIKFNPSLVLLAENLKGFNQIRTGKDYIEISKGLLEEASIDYSFDDDYESITVSGVKFDILKFSAEYYGITFKQEIIATIKNNFCLLFTLSYSEEDDRTELYQILKSIKFSASSKGKPKAL